MTAVPNEKTKFGKSKTGSSSDEKADAAAAAAGADGKPAEIADVVDPTPFEIRPKELAEMAENKSMDALGIYGGPEGLMKSLGTHPTNGLSGHAVGEGTGGGEGPFGASIEDRKRVYGINQMPPTKSKSLLQLMWLALQDKVLVRPDFVMLFILSIRFRSS